MSASAQILPFTESGTGDAPPFVLLHGFGGDARGFARLQDDLAASRRVISFDLPGHGRALDWPRIGGAGVAARAVAASLEALELERVHLVGHSMGGAAAAIMALKQPEQLASLTLLAPGGFGPEINHKLLRRYAAARDAETLEPLLEQFFGFSFSLPRLVIRQSAEARARPGVCETLVEIVESLLDGPRQQTLPLDEIATLGLPVRLVWGRQDRVLPVSQTQAVPGAFALHLLEGVGHMPHLEAPGAIARILREQAGA